MCFLPLVIDICFVCLLQNIPQIAIQSTYYFYLDRRDNGEVPLIIISLILSGLSSITTIISWCLSIIQSQQYTLREYTLKIELSRPDMDNDIDLLCDQVHHGMYIWRIGRYRVMNCIVLELFK